MRKYKLFSHVKLPWSAFRETPCIQGAERKLFKNWVFVFETHFNIEPCDIYPWFPHPHLSDISFERFFGVPKIVWECMMIIFCQGQGFVAAHCTWLFKKISNTNFPRGNKWSTRRLFKMLKSLTNPIQTMRNYGRQTAEVMGIYQNFPEKRRREVKIFTPKQAFKRKINALYDSLIIEMKNRYETIISI